MRFAFCAKRARSADCAGFGDRETDSGNLSELPMHASTQMSAHNVSDCKMMEEMGFDRAVLAREMSREELASRNGNMR
jgi:hypothetical protein